MDALLLTAVGRVASEEGIEIETREKYSGRGMFGSSTGAIVISCKADLLRLAVLAGAAAVRDEAEGLTEYEVAEAFAALRSDSMGHDIVVY